MHNHEAYMNRCFQLAILGRGSVAPNPMVGCVLVVEDKIIGEGFHETYGGPHAEVNAIAAVTDKSLLKKATLYVNLEPCAHFGKTPPCADLIAETGIPNVVIGCKDSYSEVSGKGIQKLQNAGIKVLVGVLENEARDLNKRFFTFHEKQRPYVILKWAQSSDGFMDIDRNRGEKGIAWITAPETKALVHQWRSEESAILVGWKTIANDNPHLTCREVIGKNPIRVVIDRDLRLDYNAFHVGDRKAKTFILTSRNAIGDELLQFIQTDDFSVSNLMRLLYQQSIQSIIIEGGKQTLEKFMAADLWDEARILTGQKNLGQGLKAPTLSATELDSFNFGADHIQLLKHA